MQADQPHKFSIKKRAKSFSYALKGIKFMITSQHNAWIHLIAAILVIVFGFYFDITSAEWILVIISISMVFAAELFNTALEILVDFISPDYNEKAGKIKDLAAASVLICAIAAALIGMIIFLPYLMNSDLFRQ